MKRVIRGAGNKARKTGEPARKNGAPGGQRPELGAIAGEKACVNSVGPNIPVMLPWGFPCSGGWMRAPTNVCVGPSSSSGMKPSL